ncbi:hypothetical protein ACIBG7_35705 [Nonomuraea sp. NPDC050328]|uniref:hypothetical protein n=1 Tax=Nonomuraea sp. NPDC050328 TaxID=3364361 RepID=UPI0037B775EF
MEEPRGEVLENGRPGLGRWGRAGVVAAVLALGAGALTWPQAADPAPLPVAAAATTPPSGTAGRPYQAGLTEDRRIRLGPPVEAEGRLPRLPTALPGRLSPDGAVPLGEDPVARALLLIQETREVQTTGPVFALGDDGRFRELDTTSLRPVADRHGNVQTLLDDTALSPDGRRAAFAQRDEVAVLDLTTARLHRWRLPGYNEVVSWLPDSATLLVEQEEHAYLLDLTTGEARRQPYPGFGTVAGSPGLHRLAGADLTAWDRAGRRLSRTVARPVVGVSPAWAKAAGPEWMGPGWARGGRIARDVFGAGQPRPYTDVFEAEALVVLDAATGRLDAALVHQGVDRMKGCCGVLGWYDAGTVMFTSSSAAAHRLLAWRVGTGEVFRVTELPLGTVVALGPL